MVLTDDNYGIQLVNESGIVIDAVGWGDLTLYPDYYETATLSNAINGYSFERKQGYVNLLHCRGSTCTDL